MRLFIAIELPASFKNEVARIQKEVKQMSSGGRFVPRDNFHITLHFIGESEDLVGATEAMAQAVRGIRPFELHLGKYANLEKGSRGCTSVLRVLGEMDELRAMYESLESALSDRGFSRERKQFTPHITLGRSVELDELCMGELEELCPNASMQVRSITLFESTREGSRMVYTPLHREKF